MASAPKEWINEKRVEPFDIRDFVSNIKVDSRVLYHAQDTGEEFEKYLKELANFSDNNDYTMMYYWLDSAARELYQSVKVEGNSFGNKELLAGNLFFDSLNVSHERLKKIHRFVCDYSKVKTDNPGEYRKKDDVTVGDYYDGKYVTYWYPPEREDVKKFMDSYMAFYKTNSIKDIYSNPFLKSALAHLILVRIQPFDDGNRRTSRIIQNLSFTSSINKIYGTKLKLSPLNISTNINLNRLTYMDRIHRVKFDLESDNNEVINSFFDFILNMYDEQLYFQINNLPTLLTTIIEKEKETEKPNKEIEDAVSKSKIKKLPNQNM